MSINRQQALDCFASDDLIGIGMEADAVRRQLHPEGVVTYTIEADVDCTHALEPQLTAAIEDGANGLVLHHVTAQAAATIRRTYPGLRLTAPVFPEWSAADLDALHQAGLDAVSPAGFAVADLAAAKPSLDLHRAIHRAGIASTAQLIFGAGETIEDRVHDLESLRTLQAETGGFLDFTLATAPSPTGRELDDPTAVEYLKTLAICRMVLDNIPHIHPNLRQQGLKVLQMSLRFGANDAGPLPTHSSPAPEEELRRIIRDAGFLPVSRDSLYRIHFLD